MIDTLSSYNRFRPIAKADPTYLLVVDTAPDQEPIGYDEVAAHLRLDQTTDFALVVGLTKAAREWVELYLNKKILSTAYSVSFDNFDNSGMRLPIRPVNTVTSITYYDLSGATQTLDPSLYWFSQKSADSYIVPVASTCFPFVQIGRPNAVTVNFSAGLYSSPSQVGELIKMAIKLFAANLYENRESTTPLRLSELPFGLKNILFLLDEPRF